MKSKITKFEVQQIIFWSSHFFTKNCSIIFSFIFVLAFLLQISMVNLRASVVELDLLGPVSYKYTIKSVFCESVIKSEVEATKSAAGPVITSGAEVAKVACGCVSKLYLIFSQSSLPVY